MFDVVFDYQPQQKITDYNDFIKSFMVFTVVQSRVIILLFVLEETLLFRKY